MDQPDPVRSISFNENPSKISIKYVFLPTYYNTTIQSDLLVTGFIISSNDKLQIYLLFIWSRHVMVKTIFRKGKNRYVATECNNQR